jgi:hypothetical protein
VLDIGPLFRLVAWLQFHNPKLNTFTACSALKKAIATETVTINLDIGCNLAASLIEYKGRNIEEELWHPELDNLISRAAESEATISFVKATAHQIV